MIFNDFVFFFSFVYKFYQLHVLSCRITFRIFLFFAYLPSPNLGLTPPGTYKPNARGSDACRGSNSLWTRTLDRYTREGLPECVLSTLSGPPPKTTQDRTHTPNPRIGIKIPDPAGNVTWAAGLEGRDSTDHATATDYLRILGPVV